jgi:hypothetical protein
MLLVVGGHSRNIGKTSVAAGIVRGLRDCNWTALKITRFGQDPCMHARTPCDCSTPAEPCLLTEEHGPGPGDSARLLAAGARRSFWLRAAAGRMEAALPAIQRILALGPHTIVESNSVLEVLRPDLYIMVLDFGCPDFKPSAARFLGRADAFVLIDRGLHPPEGPWDSKPLFRVRPPAYACPALAAFVRRLATGA